MVLYAEKFQEQHEVLLCQEQFIDQVLMIIKSSYTSL